MRRAIVFTLLVAALAGCAPALSRYRGAALPAMVAELGKPSHVFESAPGVRHFEWSTTDVLVLPEADYDGDPSWWTTTRPIEGSPLFGRCKVAAVAHWDGERAAWIVDRIARPSPSCRGMTGH